MPSCHLFPFMLPGGAHSQTTLSNLYQQLCRVMYDLHRSGGVPTKVQALFTFTEKKLWVIWVPQENTEVCTCITFWLFLICSLCAVAVIVIFPWHPHMELKPKRQHVSDWCYGCAHTMNFMTRMLVALSNYITVCSNHYFYSFYSR